ncbi:MAG TPA: PAS domain-containing protein, partial [Alphaproteobacteria bacterium]|nr:PAS domain-containing protein [Alphaproteobacteria bacterium]
MVPSPLKTYPLSADDAHPSAQDQESPRAAIGPEGRILHANPSFCALTGLSPDSIVGREVLWVLGRVPTGQAFTFDRVPGTDGRDITIISTPAPAEIDSGLQPLSEIAQALGRRERELSEAESIGHMGHWRWHVGAPDIVWSDGVYKIFGVA